MISCDFVRDLSRVLMVRVPLDMNVELIGDDFFVGTDGTGQEEEKSHQQ
jgi:hypothetical protein